jgi:pilus assembly protein Flp/PilA
VGRGTRQATFFRDPFAHNKLEIVMRNLCKSLVSFLKNEDGPTAVEYAVMLSLIIVVCIAAITTLGSNANQAFSFVGSNIKG